MSMNVTNYRYLLEATFGKSKNQKRLLFPQIKIPQSPMKNK